MGVRILVGTYDGTQPGAVMVDSVSGFAFGPVFDSYEDCEAFQEWLAREPYIARSDEIGLTPVMIPDPRHRAADPRTWPDNGLAKLVTFWKAAEEAAAGGH